MIKTPEYVAYRKALDELLMGTPVRDLDKSIKNYLNSLPIVARISEANVIEDLSPSLHRINTFLQIRRDRKGTMSPAVSDSYYQAISKLERTIRVYYQERERLNGIKL